MKKRFGIIMAMAGMAAVVPLSLPAQMGFGVADPSAMDTLSGASTGGGGGSSFNPINRANTAVGQANNSPFGGGSVQPPANPFGAPGIQPGVQGGQPNAFAPAAGGVDQFGNAVAGDPFSQQVPTVSLEPATLTAWAGERIVDHNSGEILQDAREISILATSTGNYFDDGKSGNDFAADDKIFTNITISDSYISPESHVVKTKLIDTLKFVSPASSREADNERLDADLTHDLQGLVINSNSDIRRYVMKPRETRELAYFNNLTPMQFSQVRVATTEPLSPLPQVTDLEREQDKKLEDWAMRFLRDFRLNPDQMDSEFYPTFLPPPPRAPNIPLPSNFTPNPQEEGEEGQAGNLSGQGFPGGAAAGGGDVFDDSVTGEPIGGASSRYF